MQSLLEVDIHCNCLVQKCVTTLQNVGLSAHDFQSSSSFAVHQNTTIIRPRSNRALGSRIQAETSQTATYTYGTMTRNYAQKHARRQQEQQLSFSQNYKVRNNTSASVCCSRYLLAVTEEAVCAKRARDRN